MRFRVLSWIRSSERRIRSCRIGAAQIGPFYKRAADAAILVGIGNMSGPMGSDFYRDEDAAQYILDHSLEPMIIALGRITITIFDILLREDQRKARKAARQWS